MNKDKSRYIKAFKTLGQNIRNIREQKNISQEELAFRVGTARNYIGCIERGEKFPSASMLLDIAQVLNSDIQEIVKNMSSALPPIKSAGI